MIKETNSYNDFKSLIKEGYSLVDCYATWCGPCRMLAPEIEEVSTMEEFSNVNFIKIDIDQNSLVPDEFNIEVVPTMLIFKDGQLINKLTGYRDANSLRQILKTIIK